MTGAGWKIVCRLNLILAALVLALVPGSSGAQIVAEGESADFADAAQVFGPVFEQYDACTGGGAASQQFPDFGDSVLQAADDFQLSGSIILNQIVALGSFSLAGPLGPVTVEIYDNDGPGNLPGTLLCSEVGLLNHGAEAEIDVWLDEQCVLGTGTYWLSVMPVMSFAEFGQWFWSSNETGYGSEFVFRDPDGLVGNPCTTWGLGTTDCGVGATFPNLCFGIGQTFVDGDDPPVPALDAFGAIVLLVIVLVTSFWLLRRRRVGEGSD